MLVKSLIKKCITKGQFRLSSGKRSDYFVDLKHVTLSALGHYVFGNAILRKIRTLPERPQAVAGIALGGCPLASAVSTLSISEWPIQAVYIRKEKKVHGTKKLVEGIQNLQPRSDIVIIEDVITTGKSAIKVSTLLRENNFTVNYVIAVLDRNEGGRQNLEKHNLRLIALESWPLE